MTRSTKRFGALFGAALVFAGAIPAQASERLISIGGDVTEIVYALGRGNDLIAVDTTSGFPSEVQQLPNVGYMRQLSAEPILALAPDHIIAVADAGPDSAVDVLQEAGVRYTRIPDEPSVEGTVAKIRAVGAAIGRDAEAGALAQRVAEKVQAVQQQVGEPAHRPRTLFLLSVGRGGLMAGGSGTSSNAMIQLAGGDNIAAKLNGYKPFEPEAMNALDPEVIVVTDRTLQALGGMEQMLAQPQFAGTTAAKNGRLIAMDGMLLLGFGPRLPEAVDTLARALHSGSSPQ